MTETNHSQPLFERGQQVMLNTYSRGNKVLASGKGSYVIDIEGNKYLDFISGIAVNVFGHANEDLAQTIYQQAQTLVHTSNIFWNQPAIELAEKIVQFTGLSKVFLGNSGAEANEAAIKFSRKFGRESKSESAYEIISLKNSFHGRTMATITASGQDAMHKDFAPNLPGFNYVPFNDSVALKEAVNNSTAAIMLETIQGEGGINVIDADFVQQINRLQKEKDILLIIDEIQTGMGRTGSMVSYESFGLKPDIVTLAKGLGAGVPIGAVVVNDKVANHISVGDHGSTFGGNPFVAQVANKVLDMMTEQEILANVQARSQQLRLALEALKVETPLIKQIKGKGLLIGIQVDVKVEELVQACYEQGLLVTQSKGNVLRILPPLNVSESEITEAVEKLKKALQTLLPLK